MTSVVAAKSSMPTRTTDRIVGVSSPAFLYAVVSQGSAGRTTKNATRTKGIAR